MISAISSENVSKQGFLTGKDILPEKYLLKTCWKAATLKTFEYSQLSKEIKTQTDIAKEHYQRLDYILSLIKQSKKTVFHLHQNIQFYFRSSII